MVAPARCCGLPFARVAVAVKVAGGRSRAVSARGVPFHSRARLFGCTKLTRSRHTKRRQTSGRRSQLTPILAKPVTLCAWSLVCVHMRGPHTIAVRRRGSTSKVQVRGPEDAQPRMHEKRPRRPVDDRTCAGARRPCARERRSHRGEPATERGGRLLVAVSCAVCGAAAPPAAPAPRSSQDARGTGGAPFIRTRPFVYVC